MPPRIGFLPAFFTVLGLVVATLAFLRIRSYETRPSAKSGPMAAQVSSPAAVSGEREVLVEGPGSSGAPVSSPAPTSRSVELSDDRVISDDPAVRSTAPVRTPALHQAPPAAVHPSVQPSPQLSTARPSPQAPAQMSAPPLTQAASAPPKEPPKEEKPEQPDLSSDNTPPRLTAIEFVPAQVEDGQETLLKIEATDDLAGVRSISGTIIAPSGATQGFACTRESGDSNRYQSRILVPKAAADGVWRVNYLSLIDQANNAASLSLANGRIPPTAAFRVVSVDSDSQGPTLRAIFLERRSMHSGEKNTLTVQADDDKSGIRLISGVFQSPARVARISFMCSARDAGTWQCEVTAPACADCGDWRLEQVQLQDKANNMTTVRADNAVVAPILLDISSTQCDATPPAIEAVAIDKRVISNAAPSIVSVSVRLTDDACGIQSVSGQVLGPAGPEGAPSNSFSFVQDRDPRTWVGRFTVPQLAAKGVWRISWLQVLDKGRNLRTYSQNDPVLQGAMFTVE